MNKIVICLFFFINISFLIGQDTTVIYSHESGFYYSPFDLKLNSSVASVEIVYTIDGSNPKTSKNSFTSKPPFVIRINPDDTSARAHTPGVIVRASIKNGNKYFRIPQCKSYIFIDKVKRQSAPGRDWPPENYQGINRHNIDYSMDSDIVDNPDYKDLINKALLDIPTISLATEVGNLFDLKTGIYVNSFSSGSDWERPCSFEIINPDNTQKFQINAGLRLKGGWSRQLFNPKYSLRLLFRKEYGAGQLDFPLFENEGAQDFNQIELRTEQNCAWTLDGTISKYNTFLRDIFARDSQRDMGWPYIRSRYYHLYINGMYWGLYMTSERVDESYAKSYFGGKENNYDVIKADELVDGNMDLWQKLWDLTKDGFESNAKYFALEAKNQFGQAIKGSQVLCDIDNLIDYMVLVFYTGNFDGPTSKWGNNKSGANFLAIKDRTDKTFGFKFFALDFEYAMMVEPVHIGTGLKENRVNIGDITGNYKMNITSLANFNPQWLHFKLCANQEYKMRFIDRAYPLYKENGELTPEKALIRFEERRKQIEYAIIAESARWGDAQTKGDSALTKEDWKKEVESLTNIFFPQRTDIVIQQLKDAGLFAVLAPPAIAISGNITTCEYYYLTSNQEIEIVNPSGTGTLYYTLNGKDPRGIAGKVENYAIKIEANTEKFTSSNSMIINARIKSGNDWSPLRQIKIFAPVTSENYSVLKVTELNYNPLDESSSTDTISGNDFEFIELKNTGQSALNISGIHLDSAVQYTFPPKTLLAPGEYFVIAGSPSNFYNRYGLVANGNFTGNFSNSGEYVSIEDSIHNKILSFTYSDKLPWPEEADGKGYSLVSADKDPTGDPGTPTYWKLSQSMNGNPFFDTTYIVTSVNSKKSIDVRIFPNPTNEFINIETDNDKNIESELELFDISGKLICKRKFTGQTILNLNSLIISKGMYFILIKNSQGSHNEKIVYQ